MGCWERRDPSCDTDTSGQQQSSEQSRAEQSRERATERDTTANKHTSKKHAEKRTHDEDESTGASDTAQHKRKLAPASALSQQFDSHHSHTNNAAHHLNLLIVL